VKGYVPFAAATLVLALHACAPNAPRIMMPQRVEAFCGSKQARPTSIASVITSTDDHILPDHPSEAGIRREVASAGGVIEYWDEQLLKLPVSSQALDESDGYARVYAVAVSIAPETDPPPVRRTIYLQVRDHGIKRWIAMDAYDVQNVCVEGKRES